MARLPLGPGGTVRVPSTSKPGCFNTSCAACTQNLYSVCDNHHSWSSSDADWYITDDALEMLQNWDVETEVFTMMAANEQSDLTFMMMAANISYLNEDDELIQSGITSYDVATAYHQSTLGMMADTNSNYYSCLVTSDIETSDMMELMDTQGNTLDLGGMKISEAFGLHGGGPGSGAGGTGSRSECLD